MNIPEDCHYTKEHEWLRVEGNEVVVGITDYAQSALGDIVFVELPKVGQSLTRMQPFGSVEAVKAVSDLFSPVTGTVTAVNGALADDPTRVNASPYSDGWMIKARLAETVKVADVLAQLLPASEYGKLVASLEAEH